MAKVTLSRADLMRGPATLAPVCVVTGSRELIAWKDVRVKQASVLAFVIGAMLCGPLGAIFITVLFRETIVLRLPFSPEGLERYERGQLVFKGALGAAIFLMLGAMGGIATQQTMLPPQLMPWFLLASALLPVVAWFGFTRPVSPTLSSADPVHVTVRLPSEVAARELKGRRKLPGRGPEQRSGTGTESESEE